MSSQSTIPVLERSLDVLEAIAQTPRGLSAKALSLDLGIPSATCYRILRTFLRRHWIGEKEPGVYGLALGLVQLTRNHSEIEFRLRQLQPVLRQLTRETGLSAKISLREGWEAVVVARTEASRPNSITSPVGSRIRLTDAGSAGVILLSTMGAAEFSEVEKALSPESKKSLRKDVATARREGIFRSYGAHHPTIYALSVPLDLGLPGALTLVGWPEDFTPQRKKFFEGRLKALTLPEPSPAGP